MYMHVIRIQPLALSSSGQRHRNVHLHCRGKRISAIGAVAVDEVVSVYCTTQAVNEEVFCDFLERNLLPQLMPFNGINPRNVVLMDNASIHHTSKAIELIQSIGALVHFIPPYSPDLDPIEELFSKVKACLKENNEAIQAADERAIVDFVRAAFSTVMLDECYSWFEHAGYIH